MAQILRNTVAVTCHLVSRLLPAKPTASIVVVALVLTTFVSAHPEPAYAAPAASCYPNTMPIAGGGFHTLSIDGRGGVWAWGEGRFGATGAGTTADVWSPLEVLDDRRIVAVSGGSGHSLALDTSGAVFAWGRNDYGQVGDGTTTDVLVPKRLEGLPPMKQVSGGNFHSVALSVDGTVWVWGDNENGQLGIGSTVPTWKVPRELFGLPKMKSVVAVHRHTLAVAEDGTVWSWGWNIDGQLGDGTTVSRNAPAKVAGLSSATAVSGGSVHSLALLADGTMRSWGGNYRGQLGDGTTTDRHTPVQVVDLTGVTSIASGSLHSLARRSDGTVWEWGDGSWHQLSNSQYVRVWRPIRVPELSDIRLIAGGGYHSIALGNDGRLSTWGWNSEGQIGDPSWSYAPDPLVMTEPVQAKPEPPRNIEAAAGEELAYVTWDEPDVLATSHYITTYVEGSPLAPVSTNSGDNAYAVTGLAKGTGYSFKVVAQNCLGDSGSSSETNRVVPTGVQLNQDVFKTEGVRLTDRSDLKVNAFNGNLSVNAIDLRIQGRSLPLVMSRSYNSRASATSVFGRNWASNTPADVRLSELANGNVFYNGPGGFQVGFARKPDGTYDPPTGVNGRLEKGADGTFTLTLLPSDEVFSFDLGGRLVSHSDRNANTISYGYDGSDRLVEIIDDQGRAVVISYDAAGHITQIEDVSGRRYGYVYTDGNLTEYVDPDGVSTLYTYDTQNRLIRVRSPEGRLLEIDYDTFSRATTLRYPLATGSPSMTFEYQGKTTGVTDANENTTTYEFDPVGRTTRVEDAAGNSTSMEYTSMSNVRTYRSGARRTVHAGLRRQRQLAFDDDAHGSALQLRLHRSAASAPADDDHGPPEQRTRACVRRCGQHHGSREPAGHTEPRWHLLRRRWNSH